MLVYYLFGNCVFFFIFTNFLWLSRVVLTALTSMTASPCEELMYMFFIGEGLVLLSRTG